MKSENEVEKSFIVFEATLGYFVTDILLNFYLLLKCACASTRVCVCVCMREGEIL